MSIKNELKRIKEELLLYLKTIKWNNDVVDFEEKSKWLKKLCFIKFLLALRIRRIPIVTYKTRKLFLVLQRLSLSG